MANEKRLIDANALFAEAERIFCVNCNWYDGKCRECQYAEFADMLVDAPTVDAVEVVHGQWLYYSTTMQECSNCKRHTARHKFKYCPHCGAVMEDKYNDG